MRSATPQDSFSPGDVVRGLVGDYTLTERLGDRLDVASFRASRDGGAEVVVKVLSLRAVGGFRELDTLEENLRSTIALAYPTVAPLVDVFVLEDRSPRAFFGLARASGASLVAVRPWVEGQSWAAFIEGRIRHDARTLEARMRSLLDALRNHHELLPSALHRAVHPGNVIVRSDGGVSLVDVGLAPFGASDYAAPEALAGFGEPASDVYSLGLTVLATATHLAPADLPRDRRTDHYDIVAAIPGLSRRVQRALAAMVEPSLARRAKTAAEVIELLDARPRFALPGPPSAVGMAAAFATSVAAVGAIGLFQARVASAPVPPPERVASPAPVEEPEAKAVDTPVPDVSPPSAVRTPWHIDFAARVRSLSGSGPRIGTACVITVTESITESGGSSIPELELSCGGDRLYESNEDWDPCGAPPKRAVVLHEIGLAGERYEYDVVAVDGGRFYASSTERRAVLRLPGDGAGTIGFDLERHSDRRAGEPVTKVVHFREAATYRGVASAVSGESAPLTVGEACDVSLSPHVAPEKNCRAEVRCHGETAISAPGRCEVSGGIPVGLVDSTPSPIDGSGMFEMFDSERAIGIGDRSAKGEWSAQIAIRPR